MELTPNGNKGYNSKFHGESTSFFHSSKNSSKNVTVFTDPFSYMKARGVNAFKDKGRQNDIVLMGLNEQSLDMFLANNSQVQILDFVTPSQSKPSQDVLSFINKLNRKYKQHSISVDTISFERIEKNHMRGIELDF